MIIITVQQLSKLVFPKYWYNRVYTSTILININVVNIQLAPVTMELKYLERAIGSYAGDA